MLLHLKLLTLEITRKCNMSCEHCMRGAAQDIDMDYKVLEEIFKQTKRIDHLLLTGGEPSLVPYQIMHIVHCAKQYGCKIGSFSCSTNGKEYSPDFVKQLRELYELCEDKQKGGLTISIDQFHEPPSPEALKEYRKELFYKPTGEKDSIKDSSILNRGRAKENSLGYFDLPLQTQIYDFDMERWKIEIGDRIYVNVNGDVFLDSDLSYEDQHEHAIGNILTNLFVEVLARSFVSTADEPEGCFYKVSLNSETGTIVLNEEISNDNYYRHYKNAAAAYQSIVRNIHMMPTADPEREVKAVMGEMLNIDSKKTVKSAVFHYFKPNGGSLGDVTLFFERIKLEDKE